MGFLSGLLGGSTKTKIKRKIPKPTKEEQDLLKRLIDITNQPITHNPNFIAQLENPYQALNSPIGLRLMDIILSGYSMPPGLNRLMRFGATAGYNLPSSTFRYGYAPRQKRMRKLRPMNIWEAIANYGLEEENYGI